MKLLLSINLLKCLFFLLLQAGVFTGISAQTGNYTGNFINAHELMTDVAGKPIYLKVEYRIEGSPFLPIEFAKADIILKGGKTFSGIDSRVNLYDNTVIAKKNDGTELVLVSNISKVHYKSIMVGGRVKDFVFEKGFSAVDRLDSTTYYEVLDSGKIKLLKHYEVNYDDKRYYGQASITRVFSQKEFYYVSLPGNITRRIGKGKEGFLSILPDKKDEMGKYIDVKKIKCKNEEDWKTLIIYYNSLSI